MSFELPEQLASLSTEGRDELYAQIAALDDTPLADLLDQTIGTFDARARAERVTDADRAELRELAKLVKHIRGEIQSRTEAAQEAAAEIDTLATEVLGEPEPPGEDSDAGTEDGGEETGTEDGGEGTEPDPESETPEAVAASTALTPRRPALDLSRVRSRQPRVKLPEPDPLPEIIAAVDVPGYAPGQALQMDGVVEGTIRRANALKTAGGGTGLVASYRLPFTDDLTVADSSSAPEGTTAIIQAANQARLPQGDVVASGGWCAPSETIYEIADVSCPDMLWDLPEIRLARGGIRYFLTPPLDVSALTWVHTEADDISGAEKPCFKIPCPDPIEVRCDAIGICLEAGILTERHFPELVAWYVRNAMVAHEIRIRQVLFEQAVASAIPVTIAPTFGAVSAVYAAVGLEAADLIEKYSLCENIALEVVFPWWIRNLFLADLARRNGVDVCSLNPGCIQDLFGTLGVRVQFARGLPPAVPNQMGGTQPATEWPSDLQFLIYPAGAFQMGRGAEVSLGVVHDSTKFSTNDYTAAFAEECVALVARGPEARAVTVPICPSGETGAQTMLECPMESPAESPSESPSSP